MHQTIQRDWFENEVRACSFAMWVAGGSEDGHSEEHWMRAARQIEERCRAALDGTDPQFAPAHLTISTPPIRRIADRTGHE
jgi:hypothetical protein